VANLMIKSQTLIGDDRPGDAKLFAGMNVFDADGPNPQALYQVYAIVPRMLNFLLENKVAAQVAIVLGKTYSRLQW
jgi:hypothetical protein